MITPTQSMRVQQSNPFTNGKMISTAVMTNDNRHAALASNKQIPTMIHGVDSAAIVSHPIPRAIDDFTHATAIQSTAKGANDPMNALTSIQQYGSAASTHISSNDEKMKMTMAVYTTHSQ